MSTTKKLEITITNANILRLLKAVRDVENMEVKDFRIALAGIEGVDKSSAVSRFDDYKRPNNRADWFGFIEGFGRSECRNIYSLPLFANAAVPLYYTVFLRELFVCLHNKSHYELVEQIGLARPSIAREHTTNVQDWCDMFLDYPEQIDKICWFMIDTNYNSVINKISDYYGNNV